MITVINPIPLFKIVDPASLALLVDGGRIGHQHRGVCAAGPMDGFAFEMGNVLLGLDKDTAIEICGSGFELIALSEVSICITGGEGLCYVNNQQVPMWQPLDLKLDDKVKIICGEQGYRFYIAINADLKTSKAHGSTSTVMRERSGGLKGNGFPLVVDDILSGQAHNAVSRKITTSQFTNLQRLISAVYKPRSLRLIKGGQCEQFDDLAWHRLMSNTYKIEKESNRMGIRFCGQRTSFQGIAMKSEAMTMGAMQIPPNGQPIVLMADRQTLGGYPKIANVAMVDISYLAQHQPATTVSFAEIDLDTARNMWRLRDNLIQQLKINRP